MTITDENERCELTEMLPTECGHCREVAQGDKEIAYWDAKYETICRWSSCLGVIDVGERVKWSSDGTAVIHASHKQR